MEPLGIISTDITLEEYLTIMEVSRIPELEEMARKLRVQAETLQRFVAENLMEMYAVDGIMAMNKVAGVLASTIQVELRRLQEGNEG